MYSKTIWAKDGYELSVRVYESENPKAVIKFIHGMEEHQARYANFAEFLCKNGYTVVTADMRGHGANAPILSHIADKDGHKLLLQDEIVLADYISQTYPDLPLYLFGHSMGTIIARNLLQTESKRFKKVVLSGYPNPQGLAGVGVMLSALIRAFKGGKGYSKMLTNLVIGPFVKAIENPKTVLDWLSFNESNVEQYAQDELCGKEFTIGSYNALFHLVSNMAKVKKYKDVNKDLPILLISGEQDPCTGGEEGREKSREILAMVGFNTVVEGIEQMRHEILNETKKEVVYNDILDFFNN